MTTKTNKSYWTKHVAFVVQNYEIAIQLAGLLYHLTFFIIALSNIPPCLCIVLAILIFLLCNIQMAFSCCILFPWCLNEQYLFKILLCKDRNKRITFFIWWSFGPYKSNFRRIQVHANLHCISNYGFKHSYSFGYKENFLSFTFTSSRVPGPCW